MVAKGSVPTFNTLKECLEFLQWLRDPKWVNLRMQMAGRLARLLDKKYASVNKQQIDDALFKFLNEVSTFHNKLCDRANQSKIKSINARDALEALLQCIPKLLSVIYFLRYNVDSNFTGVGGGKWAGQQVGMVAMYARIYTQSDQYMKHATDIEKYLIARNGSDYSAIPGGFDPNELKQIGHGGYSEGSIMLRDLVKICEKENYQLFRDVFVTSVLSKNAGLDVSNVANALRMVGDFCGIFGPETNEGEFKSHVQSRGRCIEWQALKTQCAALKIQFGKLFSKNRFSFTGYGRQYQYLDKQNIAKKMASWLKKHLNDVQLKLKEIVPLSSIKNFSSKTLKRRATVPSNIQEEIAGYFTKHLFRYGFTFEGNTFKTGTTPYEPLQTGWDAVIGDFKKDNGGLAKLKQILDGNQCANGIKQKESNPKPATEHEPKPKAESDPDFVAEPEPESESEYYSEYDPEDDYEYAYDSEDEDVTPKGTVPEKKVAQKVEPKKPLATKTDASKSVATKADKSPDQNKKSEGAQNQGKKSEGAQNQGKKAEGAQNQGKKAEGTPNQENGQSEAKFPSPPTAEAVQTRTSSDSSADPAPSGVHASSGAPGQSRQAVSDGPSQRRGQEGRAGTDDSNTGSSAAGPSQGGGGSGGGGGPGKGNFKKNDGSQQLDNFKKCAPGKSVKLWHEGMEVCDPKFYDADDKIWNAQRQSMLEDEYKKLQEKQAQRNSLNTTHTFPGQPIDRLGRDFGQVDVASLHVNTDFDVDGNAVNENMPKPPWYRNGSTQVATVDGEPKADVANDILDKLMEEKFKQLEYQNHTDYLRKLKATVHSEERRRQTTAMEQFNQEQKKRTQDQAISLDGFDIKPSSGIFPMPPPSAITGQVVSNASGKRRTNYNTAANQYEKQLQQLQERMVSIEGSNVSALLEGNALPDISRSTRDNIDATNLQAAHQSILDRNERQRQNVYEKIKQSDILENHSVKGWRETQKNAFEDYLRNGHESVRLNTQPGPVTGFAIKPSTIPHNDYNMNQLTSVTDIIAPDLLDKRHDDQKEISDANETLLNQNKLKTIQMTHNASSIEGNKITPTNYNALWPSVAASPSMLEGRALKASTKTENQHNHLYDVAVNGLKSHNAWKEKDLERIHKETAEKKLQAQKKFAEQQHRGHTQVLKAADFAIYRPPKFALREIDHLPTSHMDLQISTRKFPPPQDILDPVDPDDDPNVDDIDDVMPTEATHKTVDFTFDDPFSVPASKVASISRLPPNPNDFKTTKLNVPLFSDPTKCHNPWSVDTSTTDTPRPPPSPPPDSDHLPPPKTVREMLYWFVGLNQLGYIGKIKDYVVSILVECNKDASELSDALEVIREPYTLDASHVAAKLTEVSLYSATVVYKVRHNNDFTAFSTFDFKKEYINLHYSTDPAGLLCQLRDYAYACHHQLAFLKSQCKRGTTHGGWQGHEYGHSVSPSDSPLQAFLTDGWESTYYTHLFDPCNLCHKSRVRMGFSTKDLPEISQQGSVISSILTPSCGGSDPLLTLCSYLNCLTRRTPRTTGELVSFFHNLGNSLHDMYLDTLSPLGISLSTRHSDCPDWDCLRASDLDTVRGVGGYESIKYISNHKHDHPNTLSTLVGCGSDFANCRPHCSPITYRAYSLYSPTFAHTYLSWTVYLPDRLHESLQKLLCDFIKHDSIKCTSLHLCPEAMPLLYTHGITPPEGTSQLTVMCSDVMTKLEEIVNGGPIASLMTAMDNFLYGIREPFIFTLVALWSLAFLIFANTMLYRIDILHIRSHLIRTKASHLIDVKALLTDGTKVPSLYDIDYFDDDPSELLNLK